MRFVPIGNGVIKLPNMGYRKRLRNLPGNKPFFLGDGAFAPSSIIPPVPSVAALPPGNTREMDAKDAILLTTLPG